MREKYNQLTTLLGQIADLRHTAALLEWDQQTYMPEGAAVARGRQIATISTIAHNMSTSPELGSLLDELQSWAEGQGVDSTVCSLDRVARRDYMKEVRVPADYVEEFSIVTTAAHHAWTDARAKSAFAIFRPHLEKIVELNKRYISFFPPADHPYDTLLDNFEPGMKTAEVKAIFEKLRPAQVKLIQAISGRQQVNDKFMNLQYDEQKQWDFGVMVATAFGYDWRRGRQDRSAHPFTTSFSMDDVRITTRFEKNSGASALFSTMHETGHALYEQGISPELNRTPLEGGASLALHESQSRLWENIVGRSLPFWEYFYPQLQKIFPAHLAGIRLDDWYMGINRVERSLIRVEADEATYNLHIMLRLELEIAMIEGSINVKDLPEAWNARMQQYLGITPPDDAHGVLQDIHWAGGMLGYFSTYALGNLISAQLWEKHAADNPGIEEQMRKGDFTRLLDWLRGNIHCHGRKFEPQKLVERVTGRGIDPEPYMRYLEEKYGRIYGL